MKINLNDYVKVKLTDLGKDIYYHRYDRTNELIKSRGGKPITPKMPEVDEEGKTRIALWEFIALYGEHIGMAKPNVIEPIELESEEISEHNMKMWEDIFNAERGDKA